MRRNAAISAAHSLAAPGAFNLVSARTGRTRGTAVSITFGRIPMFKRVLMASAALALTTALSQAQEVKIGLVAPFTGIGAELGQQIDRGVEQYLKLRADEFKPYK